MLGKYTEEDGKRLIKLARQAIEEDFSGKKPEIPGEKQFRQLRGVFVTLTKNKELRGCIGFPEAIMPLNEATIKAAKSAAFSDPRFSQLQENELKDIKIEISILTPKSKCKPSEVKIGEDGLICNYVGLSGLLLPQVAVEHKMSRLEFLECVCQKAGLPGDTWQKPSFQLWKFQAQIFHE